jgi:dTMP kinase
MFISLDGIDGGGKSTQAARLCEALRGRGHDVLAVRDPGGTATGEAIRSLLLDSQLAMHRRAEAMLFMAARCELVERLIRPALRTGKVVVSDRFLLANVVYQSTHLDEASSSPLSADELWRVGEWAVGGLRPDLTLLLDLPAEVSLRRIDRPADRMESRGLPYLEAVRQAFLRELPRAATHTLVIDAAVSADQVHSQILDSVNRLLS